MKLIVLELSTYLSSMSPNAASLEIMCTWMRELDDTENRVEVSFSLIPFLFSALPFQRKTQST